MKKKEKRDYLACTVNNDIPKKKRFGYRELRIMGWVFMACLVLGTIFTNTVVITGGGATLTSGSVLSSLGLLALPAFFIANFSIIITSRDAYRSLFRKYFLFMGLVLLILFGFLYRYIVWMNYKFNGGDFISACNSLTNLLNANPSFGTCFNIFIDLLLMLFSWYFIEYTPHKHFQGKNLKYFRLLLIIPVIYELSCLSVKMVAMFSTSFTIPFFVFPFITSKPPILFFVFMAIAIREKLQERKYLALGHNKKEYQQYLTTNAASKTFSRFVAIAFLIAAIIDFAVYLVTVQIIVNDPAISYINAIKELIKIGVGKGVSFVFMIPIILFYSYNKKYKETKIDILVPIIGVIVIGVIVIEAMIDIILS